MATRSGHGRIVLAVAVLPMLAACGGTAGTSKRSLQAIAIQQTDVSGVSRCSQSGPPDAVVRALRNGGDTSGADSLAGNWSDDQGKGANDAYVVAYAATPGDCLRIFGSYGSAAINDLQSKWVVNYVVAFPSASQAKANWAQRASYLRNFDNTVGKSSGLGDNAVVVDAYPPQWFGAWSKGVWYSILATNYDAPTARTLAAEVAARMT